MTTYRFAVNVPNPTDRHSSVELRLERAGSTDLSWLHHEGVKTPMEVISAGIAGDPCIGRGSASLRLELAPFTSTDVYVVVNASPAPHPSIAAYHLIDRRAGADAGGVLLVCTDPPFAEPASRAIPTANPCPAVLAKDVYAIRRDEDPAKSSARPVVTGSLLTVR